MPNPNSVFPIGSQSNVNAVGSIARQVVRGSKSSEVSIPETLILPTSQEFSDI